MQCHGNKAQLGIYPALSPQVKSARIRVKWQSRVHGCTNMPRKDKCKTWQIVIRAQCSFSYNELISSSFWMLQFTCAWIVLSMLGCYWHIYMMCFLGNPRKSWIYWLGVVPQGSGTVVKPFTKWKISCKNWINWVYKFWRFSMNLTIKSVIKPTSKVWAFFCDISSSRVIFYFV
jgi:hypothetical protein